MTVEEMIKNIDRHRKWIDDEKSEIKKPAIPDRVKAAIRDKILIYTEAKKAVIYRDDLYKDTKEVKASKRMLKTAGVDIIEYQSTGRVLEITL